MSWFKKFFGLEDNPQEETRETPKKNPEGQHTHKTPQIPKANKSSSTPRVTGENIEQPTGWRHPVTRTDGVVDWYYRFRDDSFSPTLNSPQKANFPQERSFQWDNEPPRFGEISDEQLETLRGPSVPDGTIVEGSKEANKGQSAENKNGATLTPPPKIEVVYDETKLTIILIENTEEVAKEKDKLEKIVKSLATTGYVCVINYGTTVREGKKIESTLFECNTLLCNEDVGTEASLYDALVILENVVKKYYKSVGWLKFRRARITTIDIIGIGRCFDNCSVASIEKGIEAFENAVSFAGATTKYFCLSEDGFIDAATIGFRSIGAITRSYYA